MPCRSNIASYNSSRSVTPWHAFCMPVKNKVNTDQDVIFAPDPLFLMSSGFSRSRTRTGMNTTPPYQSRRKFGEFRLYPSISKHETNHQARSHHDHEMRFGYADGTWCSLVGLLINRLGCVIVLGRTSRFLNCSELRSLKATY